MIPSMALIVMLNLSTWLKSKVNTHSFKIKLEEKPLYSEVYAQGLILRIKLSYTILFCKFEQIFLKIQVFDFGNLAILLLLVFNMTLHSTVF